MMRTLLKKLWGLIRNDIWLKVVALLFAVILWSYVLADTNPMREKNIVNIPVQYIGMEDLAGKGLAVRTSKTPLAMQVQASVDVRQTSFLALTAQNVDAVVDLSKISSPGTHLLSVDTTSTVGQVTGVSPREVRIEIDKSYQREIPLSFSLKNTLAEGYWMGEPQLPSSTVSVKGAQQDVIRMSRAVCEIPLENLADNLRYATTAKIASQVKLLDESGEVIDSAIFESTQDVVDVSIAVAPKRSIDVSAADDITGGNELAAGYEIASIVFVPAKVDIIGDYDLIHSLPSLSVTKVSVRGANAPIQQKAQLILPEGVQLTGSNEVEIKIDIREKEQEKIFEKRPVAATGAGQGLKVSLNPATVDIRVMMPISKLKWYGPRSITAYVDVTGLTPGKYMLPLQFQIPNDLSGGNVSASIEEVEVVIE
jgi:YbbR domain-containing protein